MSNLYDESVMDALLEAALHSFMMQRCERAYIHELRDGLQGISVGIDALARVAEGKGLSSVSSARIVSLAKRALQTHDQGIGAVVKQLVLQRDEPGSIELNGVLRHIATMLRNDAAARDISIRVDSAMLYARARASRIRLVLLCLATSAIDALQSSELLISSATAESGGVIVRFALPVEKISIDDAWIAAVDTLSANEGSFKDAWMLHAVQAIVRADSGAFEAGRESVADRLYQVVRVRYAAELSASDAAARG